MIARALVVRALLSLSLLCLLTPSAARADLQWSSRLAVGGGAREVANLAEAETDLALRVDLLLGAPEPEVVRVGPHLELRTGAFDTAEIGGGLTVLLPVVTHGFPLMLTGGAGYASREGPLDGPFAFATVALGYRAYNYHSAYGFGLALYVTGRTSIDDDSVREITAGVEIDLEFLIAIPAMFVVQLLGAEDPDEPPS